MIPRSLWLSWTNVLGSGLSELPVFKKIIKDPVTGDELGRFAYVIFNCSGLLDANYAGGTTRSNGLSTGEIQLNSTLIGPEATNMTAAWYIKRTNIWKRFETEADLDALTYPDAKEYPSNFFVYSRSPVGWLDSLNHVQQPVYVGGNAASLLTNEVAIKSNLTLMATLGAPASEVDNLFLNLIDYVDADSIPGNRNGTAPANCNSFCTENVPMISEVVVSNWYTVTTSGMDTFYTNSYQILFEIYYPFAAANPNNFTLLYGAQYEANLKPGNLAVPSVPLNGPWTPGRFMVVTSIIQRAGIMSNTPPDLTSAKVQFFARVNSAGNKVDEVGFAPYHTYINIGPQLGAPGTYRAGKSVRDPRINWNAEDASQWEPNNSETLGATNPAMIAAFTAAGADGEALAYVRNAELKTPGELGMLLYDHTKPWTTMRLIGSGSHPILGLFTTTNASIRKGRVSMNTPHREVLASVFLDAAPQSWPEQHGATPLTSVDALTLADALIAAGPFENVGEITRLGSANNTLLTLTAAQSEGIIRNTSELLTTRHQVFAILLSAYTIDKAGNVGAEQKVFAIVWRDPFPKPDGSHEIFIRFFKWMTSLT
jgi:hypothetical protein